MASKAPPVLPRLKSDDKLYIDVSQTVENEQISPDQNVTVMLPSKAQSDIGTSRVQVNRPLAVNSVQGDQLTTSITIKREPHSPSPYSQRVVNTSMDVTQPDQLDEEESGECGHVSYEESLHQTMSVSSDLKSMQDQGDDLTDMTAGSQLAAMEAMVRSACPSSKGIYGQSGSESTDEARVVRTKFTWRPEKPVTLEMLQNMSREKGWSTSSTPKGLQSLPEVPALSRNKSVSGGDQSLSEITKQTGKQSVDRSSVSSNDGTKGKPPPSSTSPKPWDAELRVFTSSAGQLDSQTALEQISKQAAESKRRREAQEKNIKNSVAKVPRKVSGSSVAHTTAVKKSAVPATRRQVEEQTNGSSKTSDVPHQQSSKRSTESRSSPGLVSDPAGIIEYSSKELQEKTLQQVNSLL
jgi:hypothetical protein